MRPMRTSPVASPSSYGALAARRLEALREVDFATHDALRLALPGLVDCMGGTLEVAELAELLAQIAAETSDAALALASRLHAEPEVFPDMVGLRKWALHGLQRHREDPLRRLSYFEAEDPLVFADERTEQDAAHLLRRREALLHYLGGFGYNRYGLDLHEPQPAKHVPPSVAIGDELIRFPRRLPGIAAQHRDALYFAAIAHAAAHLRHSPLRRAAGNRLPMVLTVMALIEDARVERAMQREFPGLRALWGVFHVATRESAGFEFAGLAARLARALHDPGYPDANAWVVKGRRLFEEAAAADLHDVAAFDRVARLLAIDIEKMRLRVPRDYRTQPAYRDDNALLWNLNAALPEDEVKTVVREDFELRPQDQLPPDVRQADVDLRRRTLYPEWDHRLEAVREDWATVIENPRGRRRSAAARLNTWPRSRIQGLERTPDRSIRLARLAEGDELDLNAAVHNVIDLRARLAPDGRIFRRHGRRRRATAIVLLMDLSVSTGRFVPGSFTTVLQAEKQAAAVVALALGGERDRVAVHGFSSNGRHEVHYQHIKDFDEPFDAHQQADLVQLTGSLSTRMGAALRHASAALTGQTADHKVILMLTDGEPSDVDVFDDDYLVEDARHAVTSAASRGIRTFCLTLDRHADAYVRRIFGARNYLIADRANAFAGQTGQALVRLIAQ
jgi:nitric oxide reductase NorD protein